MSAPYHTVTFFVRVSLGFGALAEVAPEEMRDFVVEQKIDIRPRTWRVPRAVSGQEDAGGEVEMSEEEWAKEAYRRKGRDRVGEVGTYRPADHDGPPGFDEAGPSTSQAPMVPDTGGPSSGGGLPTFLESQAASGSPAMGGAEDLSGPDLEDRTTAVGRRGSLGGELGTWVEVSSLFIQYGSS
jgi:hypothetical protein